MGHAQAQAARPKSSNYTRALEEQNEHLTKERDGLLVRLAAERGNARALGARVEQLKAEVRSALQQRDERTAAFKLVEAELLDLRKEHIHALALPALNVVDDQVQP